MDKGHITSDTMRALALLENPGIQAPVAAIHTVGGPKQFDGANRNDLPA